MNKLFTTLILMLGLVFATAAFAQGYGGDGSSDDRVSEEQGDFPVAQPTPIIDVPPPNTDDDQGNSDFSDYSGN